MEKPHCKQRDRKPGCIFPRRKRPCAQTVNHSVIPITLTDAAGIWKPCANAKVHLKIEGPAALQALGSAATQTDETYLGSSHTTWLGRALAVIRAGTEPGKVRVTVTAEGYEPQYVDLTVE